MRIVVPAHSSDQTNTRRLLHRLNSSDAGTAWAEFIDRFSPLIMHAVRQFEFEQDRANDCYLFVFERLSDNGFRRLLKFDTSGKARFSTWLTAVVYNLCVDWHRHEYGRAQMIPAISALPALERCVYKLHFEQAMDREACFQTLSDEFPDLERTELSAAITQVFRVLTPRQRWQLNLRHHRKQLHRGSSTDVETLSTQSPDPDRESQSAERRDMIEAAMAALEPEQRLVLNLRYVEGVTLSKIADLLHLGDPFKARRIIDKALDALFRLLPAQSGEDF